MAKLWKALCVSGLILGAHTSFAGPCKFKVTKRLAQNAPQTDDEQKKDRRFELRENTQAPGEESKLVINEGSRTSMIINGKELGIYCKTGSAAGATLELDLKRTEKEMEYAEAHQSAGNKMGSKITEEAKSTMYAKPEANKNYLVTKTLSVGKDPEGLANIVEELKVRQRAMGYNPRREPILSRGQPNSQRMYEYTLEVIP